MTKITFKDLPDTSTPLNASNLNTLQDNVENAINTVAGDIPTIDSLVSTSSTNPVENQAITNYVNSKISNTQGTSQSIGYSQEYINTALLDNYSNTEEVIGTWIDGKPLYRMTLKFNNNGGGTSTVDYTLSNYGISNVDLIFIVHPSFYTLTYQDNSVSTYPFQYNDGSRFECNVSRTKLSITLGYAPISSSMFVITLEYTKTTD